MSPDVAILLCTCNGQKFLAAQLNSLATQTFKNWRAWASDDGSDDGTQDILRSFQSRWGSDRLTLLQGPRQGAAANFMSLVHNDQVNAEYFAYCDQDDIWEADKLERAVRALAHAQSRTGPARPLLYGTRTRYIDESDKELGFSALFRKPPSFANALVQCIAGGNTMIYNRPARAILAVVPNAQEIVMHDWWTYIAVTACGGKTIYDPYPAVRYRQHTGNEMGMNTTLGARLRRAQGLLDGRFSAWTAINIAALRQLDAQLTPQARCQLEWLEAARRGNAISRTRAFSRSGVYRQTAVDNMALTVMAMLGRL